MPTLIKRKVTLYFRGEFFGNIHKVECTAFHVETAPYAQYTQAVWVHFVPKGKRNARRMIQSYQPDLLVLDGWGHPDPDSLYTEAKPATPGVVVASSRHSACSDGWANDFAALMAPYIPLVTVLADYRGHRS